jgi:hypothetical protein
MAVRALITKVHEPEIQGEALLVAWRHVFYGSNVPTAWDGGTGSILITSGMTASDIKSAIKTAIQADCTALGYGALARAPQHIDEVFHNL